MYVFTLDNPNLITYPLYRYLDMPDLQHTARQPFLQMGSHDHWLTGHGLRDINFQHGLYCRAQGPDSA